MKSFRNYFAIVFFVLAVNGVNAQDTLTSATVDQKTFQLFTDKNWTELIKFGNQAINKGYDYYYLQLRVGIAYYEKKNYALAEGYFLNALKFNSDDELILEYIYYCYLFNGRYDEARGWSKKFSTSLAEKIGTDKLSKVSLVMVEAGTKVTDQKNYYSEGTRTNSNYFNPPVYAQVGLNHYIKNKVSLFHAITYFNQETFVNKVSQAQYFLKASIPFKHNWSISPSFDLIHIKNTTEIQTGSPSQGSGNGTPKRPRPSINVSQSNYLVGSLFLQKTIKKFVFGVGTSVSNMNNKTQYIHSGFTSYSPFGNSKIILGTTLYAHTVDSYNTTCLAVSPFIYFRPIKRLSLKFSYLYNTNNNIIEDNGYSVNNSPDLTQSRYSALLNFSINKKVSLYGLYQLENKQEVVQLFNYKYNVFVAGIRITPFKK
jgi:tetratricopeptide (TPR) repeat protein